MINILIGSNGSGKTNFISLFKLLQTMLDGELQAYIAKQGGPNTFLHFGSKRTEEIDVKFFFGENGYHFTLVPTVDDRMMLSGEWFYWTGCGDKKVASGQFESQWQNGSNFPSIN